MVNIGKAHDDLQICTLYIFIQNILSLQNENGSCNQKEYYNSAALRFFVSTGIIKRTGWSDNIHKRLHSRKSKITQTEKLLLLLLLLLRWRHPLNLCQARVEFSTDGEAVGVRVGALRKAEAKKENNIRTQPHK